jgi:plastocyanin
MLLFSILAACDFGEHVSNLPLDHPQTAQDDTDGPAAADTGSSGGVDHIVTMKGNAFIPDELTIAQGDTVTWVNEDPWFHIVADGTPEDTEYAWISPTLDFGERWTLTLDEPGDHIYYCWNHAAIMRDAHIILEAR